MDLAVSNIKNGKKTAMSEGSENIFLFTRKTFPLVSIRPEKVTKTSSLSMEMAIGLPGLPSFRLVRHARS
jgi:hypothetical protein